MIEFNPIHHLTIFNIKIQVWGLLALISIMLAFFLVYKKVKKEGLDTGVVYDLLLISIIFGLLGARLFYAIENGFEDFFYLHKGGLSWYGFLLAYLAILVYLKIKKLPFRYLEIIVIFLPLAHAIGRIGCFVNWDDYGIYTNLPWGIKVNDDLPRHPSQLYESLSNLLIFFILFFVDRNKKVKNGLTKKNLTKNLTLIHIYFLLYPFFRFFLDFLRDSARYFGLTFSQWISIAIFIFTSIAVVFSLK